MFVQTINFTKVFTRCQHYNADDFSDEFDFNIVYQFNIVN